MGSPRYSGEYYRLQLPPCANCGKEHGGFMGSSSWGHSRPCCSDACGIRLGQRIKNGMLAPDSYGNGFPMLHYADDQRLENLRERIKHLEHQLKRNGIRVIGTKWDVFEGEVSYL